MHAATNAASVPILAISATVPIGAKPAMIERIVPVPMITVVGVLVLGLMREKNFGNSPSRDMASRIRVWP